MTGKKESTDSRPTPPPPPPQPGGASPPPLPQESAGAGPGPPPLPVATTPSQKRSLVLVRAMVAAAAADGVIDSSERRAIVGQLAASGADDEERAFLESEMANPPSLDELLPLVEDQEMAEQFYAASLLAIALDHDAERAYLKQVASRLELADETLVRLHNDLGLTADLKNEK